MRYSKDQKAATRKKVLDSAAAAVRRHGLDGLSINAIMGQAELMHGGFYTHFESRDDLVAEAVSGRGEA